MNTKFRVGDMVLISPQVTGEKEWRKAEIIEIEKNPFGIVIVAKTDDENVFFEREDMFKILNDEVLCMQ